MCMLMLSNALLAQRVTVDYILGGTETQVNHYTMPPDFYSVQMPFSFATDSFTNKDRVMFEKYPVYQVDLVFSDFRSSITFSQEELNRRRLEALHKSLPQLFKRTTIDWRLIRQMDGATRSEAQGLYHGFVFHFRVPRMLGKDGKMLELDAKVEKDLIHSALLDTLPTDYAIGHPCLCLSLKDTIIHETVRVTPLDTTTNNLYIPVRRKRRLKEMRFKRKFIFGKRKLEEFYSYDTTRTYDTLIAFAGITLSCSLAKGFYTTDAATFFAYWNDTVVSKTFNEHPEWKDILVVEDVTSSMGHYAAQTLLWRRRSKAYDRIQHWAFFNDGDGHPDGPIGKSDGVYFIKSEEGKPVEKMVNTAMSKGFGGNGPENDIEAMLKGLKRSKFRPKAIVLIADNLSPVRDLELFRQLQKAKIPIYVIACGTRGVINVEYIEIARRTKGKVFTIEGELKGLMGGREGDQVRFGYQRYIIKNGRLTLRR